MLAHDLAGRLAAGDVRALARAIRMVEDRDPEIARVLREVRSRTGRAHIVGVTGPPGSGKSTLCDQVIERWRSQGHRVGVIAVDPSSPFSGGAILGDRIRMQRHTTDSGVFIRSMAARGHVGGLAAAAREAVRLLDAGGRDRCLVETVGVGQSELEVMRTADTTVVVTTPAAGDAVQIIKAGILEIADIFVVNKADLPGAAKVYRDLKDLVRQTKGHAAWQPPVIQTSAQTGNGVDELVRSPPAASWNAAGASACAPRSRRSWSSAPPIARGVRSTSGQWKTSLPAICGTWTRMRSPSASSIQTVKQDADGADSRSPHAATRAHAWCAPLRAACSPHADGSGGHPRRAASARGLRAR